jgi:hypothetical protein
VFVDLLVKPIAVEIKLTAPNESTATIIITTRVFVGKSESESESMKRKEIPEAKYSSQAAKWAELYWWISVLYFEEGPFGSSFKYTLTTVCSFSHPPTQAALLLYSGPCSPVWLKVRSVLLCLITGIHKLQCRV